MEGTLCATEADRENNDVMRERILDAATLVEVSKVWMLSTTRVIAERLALSHMVLYTTSVITTPWCRRSGARCAKNARAARAERCRQLKTGTWQP
jgi:hypothetical protein